MISDIVGRFLPATILLLLILGTWNKKRLSSFPFIVSVCVCVVMAFAIATLPDDYSIDKPRYISLFHNRFYWGFSEEYKDVGWMFYVTCCAKMFRNNVLLFFLVTRKNFRTPQQFKRQQEFKKKTMQPKGITRHKCAICGRTEESDPTEEFRFCSKCEGNYEYCSRHLYTHVHVKRDNIVHFEPDK